MGMSATAQQLRIASIGGIIRREVVLRRINVLTAKEASRKELEAKVDGLRAAAAERVQSAVDDFVGIVRANAMAKRKKKREEEVALFLLLIADEEENAFFDAIQELAKENAPVESEVTTEQEAVAFSATRQPLLRDYPERVLKAFDDTLADLKEAKANDVEIRQELNKTAALWKGSKAQVLVETEAQAVIVGAQLVNLKRAGFKTVKWVTMGDDRVRASHLACEDQGAVAIGSKFANGLKYPLDPAGSPSETCNCRCWLEGVRR